MNGVSTQNQDFGFFENAFKYIWFDTTDAFL